jgi:hypothetical protein
MSKILNILANAAFCIPDVPLSAEAAIAVVCIPPVIEIGNNRNCEVCGYSYLMIVFKNRFDVPAGNSNSVGDLIPNSPVYRGGMAWA